MKDIKDLYVVENSGLYTLSLLFLALIYHRREAGLKTLLNLLVTMLTNLQQAYTLEISPPDYRTFHELMGKRSGLRVHDCSIL